MTSKTCGPSSQILNEHQIPRSSLVDRSLKRHRPPQLGQRTNSSRKQRVGCPRSIAMDPPPFPSQTVYLNPPLLSCSPNDQGIRVLFGWRWGDNTSYRGLRTRPDASQDFWQDPGVARQLYTKFMKSTTDTLGSLFCVALTCILFFNPSPLPSVSLLFSFSSLPIVSNSYGMLAIGCSSVMSTFDYRFLGSA